MWSPTLTVSSPGRRGIAPRDDAFGLETAIHDDEIVVDTHDLADDETAWRDLAGTFKLCSNSSAKDSLMIVHWPI